MTMPAATDLLAAAHAAFREGRAEEAMRLCHRHLQRTPGDAATRRLLGMARLVTGDPAAALVLLEPVHAASAPDLELELALGETMLALGRPADAIPHFRAAQAFRPQGPVLAARLGFALLNGGDPAAAKPLLAFACGSPAPEPAWSTHLGMAYLAMDDAAAAIGPLARAAAADPDDGLAPFQLGLARHAAGDLDGALSALADAVCRDSGRATFHTGLGDVLLARGEATAAALSFREAVRLDPAAVLAWGKLGDALQLAGDEQGAVAAYRRAHALAPGDRDVAMLLGNALYRAGDEAVGIDVLAAVMASAPWATNPRATNPRARGGVPGRGARPRVAVLAAIGAANTPTAYLLDRRSLAAEPVFLLPGHPVAPDALGRAFDVAFNAISDSDAAPVAAADAARLVAGLGLPCLNAPAAVAATRRDRLGACLAGIPGLVVPDTVRCAAGPHLAATFGTLPGRDGHVPTLLRPVGEHGGRGLTRHDDRRSLLGALAGATGEVYLTAFHDFRSADGLYRKVRLAFVAGEVFPVHMAIGDGWLSHYYRTDTAGRAAYRAEEALFLADPRRHLGGGAMEAAAAAAARTGLDYGGIDCALGADGTLLVFECNATMLVRAPDRSGELAHKRAAAERVRDAFTAMVRSRTG